MNIANKIKDKYTDEDICNISAMIEAAETHKELIHAEHHWGKDTTVFTFKDKSILVIENYKVRAI